MTEPEQWARDLEAQSFLARHEHGPKAAALTIQRAFEERERELREALKPFADCCWQIRADESDEEWAKFRLLIKNYRRARQALATRQLTPTEGTSHD